MKFSNALYRRVRSYAVEDVTSRDEIREVDPKDAGLTRDSVEAIWKRVEALYKTRTNPAVALCVRRAGKIVLNRAIGHAHGNAPHQPRGTPTQVVTPHSLFNLFSASKAITATLIHLLDQRGTVRLDDLVVDFIPEFGKQGKESVTIRQLLNHRAGIPRIPKEVLDVQLLSDWSLIIDILCNVKPRSRPGSKLAYHALSAGFILAEVIHRATGKDIRSFLRDEFLQPLGINNLNYGIQKDRAHEVVRNAYTGVPPVFPLTIIIQRALGINLAEATDFSNHEGFLTQVVPSGNIIGTAEETSRFFQLLLDDGQWQGRSILDPRTIRRALREQSYLEIDRTLGWPVRYGVGYMLGTKYLSPFGYNSPRAFGHIGLSNVIAYADPDRDISVCLMTSGKALVHTGALRWLQVMWTIAKRCPRSKLPRDKAKFVAPVKKPSPPPEPPPHFEV